MRFASQETVVAGVSPAGKKSIAAGTAASTKPPVIQRLSWRAFAIRKNFRNRRSKIINARARHDDAVAAAVSFFRDTQEPPALIFSELYIEMFALNLQFFRLDDIIHFALRAQV